MRSGCIFGVLAFWGGLTLEYADSEVFKFLYFCINFLMIGVGVYFVHLAADVFKTAGFFLLL
jgi:fucose permease